MDKEYLIKVWEERPKPIPIHGYDPKVLEVLNVYSQQELFEWIEKNRDKLFSVYEMHLVLDLS